MGRNGHVARRGWSHSPRRTWSVPSLPVIHEDECSGGDGGGVGGGGSGHGHDHDNRGVTNDNDDDDDDHHRRRHYYYHRHDDVAIDQRVVWPPEDDDTWPPREEDPEGGGRWGTMMISTIASAATTTMTSTDYGTVVLLTVFPDEHDDFDDSISSASSSSHPSSSSLSSGGMDGSTTAVADDRRRPHSSYSKFSSSLLFEDDQAYYRRKRRRRGGGEGWRKSTLACAALFAISLSTALWMPLLRPSSYDGEDRLRRGRKKDGDIDDDDIDIDDDYDYDDGRSWSWALSKPYDRASSPGGSASSTGNDGDSRGGTSDDRADEDDIDDPADVFLRRNVSFAELASVMVPAYFQRTVDLCAQLIVPAVASSVVANNDTADDYEYKSGDDGNDGNGDPDRTSVTPDGVYPLRKAMLRTRDLLDVFSLVYSRRSSLDDYVGRAAVPSSFALSTRVNRWGKGKRERVELDVESDGRTNGKGMGHRRRRRKRKREKRDDDNDGRKKKRYDDENDDLEGGGAGEGGSPSPSYSFAEFAERHGGGEGFFLSSILSRGFKVIGEWKFGKKKKGDEVEGGTPGTTKTTMTTTTAETKGGSDDGTVLIEDLWWTLRKFLDVGYTLLGNFQDLDHANVTYDPARLLPYQRRIWEWRSDFMTFVETNGPIVSFYLSLPCKNGKLRPATSSSSSSTRRDNRCTHVHRHSSHLFWGSVSSDELPDGNVDGGALVLGRLGYAQLGRVKAYLHDALTYEYVLNSTLITGAEASTDDTLGGDNVGDLKGKGVDENDGGGYVNVQTIYHNARKELRSFLDELDLFGGFLLPGTSVIPEIARAGHSYAALVSANDLDIDEEIRQRIDRAIHSLSTMKTMLGDLHDDQVAYSIYNDWNVHSEDSVLRTSVETKWKDFRSWANEVDIFATIDFLRDSLHTDESLSSEGKEEGKEKEEKAGDLESFLIDHRYNPTNHVVLGNDAGDADSIVSAITLAYIESMNSTGHDCSTPIVSISKDTFIHERPETNLLFQLAGIKDNVAEKLLFIEDLQEILEKNAKGGLCPGPSVSLVDHNTLNDSLLRFQDDLIVTEILDHHEDEHKYEETCFGDRRIIAFDDGHVLVASTTTLVAERLRLQKIPHPYPASIGTLLLGVILLDSINLDESIGKVTERDRVAVDDLLANTDWNAAVQSSHIRMDETGTITVDSNALFDTLQLAKYDPKYWDELPALRALASDYKHFGDDEARNESEFGISSILMSGEDFMKKEDFEKATLEFMHTSQIFLLGIIFVFYDELGVLLKQIAFISSDVNFPLCEFVDSFLVSDEYKNVDLQLIEVPHLTRTDQSELLQIRLFDQENLTPSRKQIGPMLEDYFDTRIL